MDKKEWLQWAAEEVRSRISIRDIVTPKKARDGGYICPICDSGTKGQKGEKTGAFHIYDETKSFSCYSCHAGGDVSTLYAKLNNMTNGKAIEELAARIGLYYDDEQKKAPRPAPKPPTEEQKLSSLSERETAPKDYTAYYKECADRLFAADNSGWAGMEYLLNRGIDLDVMGRFWIGYDPKSDPAGKGHPTPRIIIPTSESHYVARAISDDCPVQYRKMNPAGSPAGFFNIKTLRKQETQEVFVCEGAIDALSFLSVGAEAIAINSTAQGKRFIKTLEENRPRADITFIIAMDNDDAGKTASGLLASGLRRLGLPFIVASNLYGKHKDANEALCADKAAFMESVERARGNTAARPDNTSAYIDDFMQGDIEHFNCERKTGFQNFDKITGGLFPALYVLAAISSLGKTSFALQLADQMAAAGNDVLFFSLEMSRLELVSKSIARTAAQLHPDQFITSTMIRKGEIPADAVAKYKESVKDRLSIIEGNFEINISSIGDYVRKYTEKTGTRPVVIVDYLQILQPAPEDAKKGKREGIDNTVSELKRLSRELDAPIVVISSVNRANYQAPVAFESLKESGNIEYSADVVLGLQLQCLNDPLFADEKKTIEKREKVKQEKQANPRRIELVALKNRFGVSSFSCFYKYYPSKDLFEETEEADATQPAPFTKWTRATEKDIPA